MVAADNLIMTSNGKKVGVEGEKLETVEKKNAKLLPPTVNNYWERAL